MSNARRHGDKWRGLSHAGNIYTWFTNSHKTPCWSAKTTLEPLFPAAYWNSFEFYDAWCIEPVLKLLQECLMRHHARPSWWRTDCLKPFMSGPNEIQNTANLATSGQLRSTASGSLRMCWRFLSLTLQIFARQGLNAQSTEESVRQSLGKFGAISSIKARSHRSHHTMQQPL